jgi:hypothetical protein
MSQEDKLAAFGQWLTERTVQHEAMLYSTCANVKMPVDGIRMKYGQLEALKTCLQAFTVLFQKDLEVFRKEYMEGEPDELDSTE